jgi:hypothetical protein
MHKKPLHVTVGLDDSVEHLAPKCAETGQDKFWTSVITLAGLEVNDFQERRNVGNTHTNTPDWIRSCLRLDENVQGLCSEDVTLAHLFLRAPCSHSANSRPGIVQTNSIQFITEWMDKSHLMRWA